MSNNAMMQVKKATYRLAELIGNIPAARLKDEKNALATQLGIGMHQLNRFIRGNSDPSGTQLRIIASFFGTTVDDLYLPDADS